MCIVHIAIRGWGYYNVKQPIDGKWLRNIQFDRIDCMEHGLLWIRSNRILNLRKYIYKRTLLFDRGCALKWSWKFSKIPLWIRFLPSAAFVHYKSAFEIIAVHMETSSIWLNNRYSEIDWASNSIHIHICRICILQLRECNAIRLKSTGPIIFHIPGIKLLFSYSLLQCTLTHTVQFLQWSSAFLSNSFEYITKCDHSSNKYHNKIYKHLPNVQFKYTTHAMHRTESEGKWKIQKISSAKRS